jgi:hypothetical protein
MLSLEQQKNVFDRVWRCAHDESGSLLCSELTYPFEARGKMAYVWDVSSRWTYKLDVAAATKLGAVLTFHEWTSYAIFQPDLGEVLEQVPAAIWNAAPAGWRYLVTTDMYETELPELPLPLGAKRLGDNAWMYDNKHVGITTVYAVPDTTVFTLRC